MALQGSNRAHSHTHTHTHTHTLTAYSKIFFLATKEFWVTQLQAFLLQMDNSKDLSHCVCMYVGEWVCACVLLCMYMCMCACMQMYVCTCIKHTVERQPIHIGRDLKSLIYNHYLRAVSYNRLLSELLKCFPGLLEYIYYILLCGRHLGSGM